MTATSGLARILVIAAVLSIFVWALAAVGAAYLAGWLQ